MKILKYSLIALSFMGATHAESYENGDWQSKFTEIKKINAHNNYGPILVRLCTYADVETNGDQDFQFNVEYGSDNGLGFIPKLTWDEIYNKYNVYGEKRDDRHNIDLGCEYTFVNPEVHHNSDNSYSDNDVKYGIMGTFSLNDMISFLKISEKIKMHDSGDYEIKHTQIGLNYKNMTIDKLILSNRIDSHDNELRNQTEFKGEFTYTAPTNVSVSIEKINDNAFGYSYQTPNYWNSWVVDSYRAQIPQQSKPFSDEPFKSSPKPEFAPGVLTINSKIKIILNDEDLFASKNRSDTINFSNSNFNLGSAAYRNVDNLDQLQQSAFDSIGLYGFNNKNMPDVHVVSHREEVKADYPNVGIDYNGTTVSVFDKDYFGIDSLSNKAYYLSYKICNFIKDDNNLMSNINFPSDQINYQKSFGGLADICPNYTGYVSLNLEKPRGV